MNHPYMARHRDERPETDADDYHSRTYNDPTAIRALRNIERRERPRPYGPRWQPPRTR